MIDADCRPTPVSVKISEDDLYRQRISDICKVPFEEVINMELSQLRDIFKSPQSIRDNPVKFDIARKYLSGISREDLSAQVSLEHNLDGLLDTVPCAMSYGKAADFYQKALKGYLAVNRERITHTAILAGAFSSVSMLEFASLVQSTIPEAKCLTVDPNPTDKPQSSSPLCLYIQLDACDLPFNKEIDSVHTSGLLDYLGSKDRPYTFNNNGLTNRRRLFFKSVFQALRQGGILVMIERPTFKTKPPQTQPYIRELEETGFRNIAICKPPVFNIRRHQDRYFRGTAKEIPQEYLSNNTTLIGITATA